MGNRGSKSNGLTKVISFVKEQRTDGSCYKDLINKSLWLRYVLLGRESDYQTRSLSNLISKNINKLRIPVLSP
jgi:hypothetical protein